MKSTSLHDVSTSAVIADQLGEARAELKTVKDRIEFLEGLLKGAGETSVDGEKFHVGISYDVVTKRIDWKAVASKFNPSRQLLAAHTKVSVSDRVRVSAHKKEV